MNTSDFYSLLDFTMVWLQPIFWMYFFYFKSKKLNNLMVVLMPVAIMLLGISYLLKGMIPFLNNVIQANPIITLFMFYIGVGFVFALYLMVVKKWDFPQAIAISVLVVFIGSHYWEVPYLITNAFILGFQLDWVLHLVSLMFVWFILKTTGWKTDKKSLGLIVLGLVIATLFMLGWYIPPSANANETVWNTPYYMLDRLICTVIVFLAIKKDAPVWRKKKVDNIQNTS
jgi:hypothetical protein